MENTENNERKVFYIDLGELTKEQEKEYIERVKDIFMSEKHI